MLSENHTGLWFGLGGVPVLNRNVDAGLQGCVELEVLGGFFQVVGPVFITETYQPSAVCWDAAYFFGKTRISTSRTIWIRLLLRSGDIPMISLVA